MKITGKISSIVFLSLFIFAVGCMNHSAGDTVNAASGELTPNQVFTLKDLEGADVNINTLLTEKKAVLLNFWATWCPPCQEEIPDLIKLQEKYKDKSFTILGIDQAESVKRVASFVKKNGVNYPTVMDTESAVAESFGVVGIPTSILVTSDKKIVGVYYGFTRQMEEDIEKVLA